MQAAQFGLQCLEFPDARDHVPNVLLKKRVHRAAFFIGSVLEMQQHPDLIERHVQAAAMADEGQALDVAAVIDPVVGVSSFSVQ